jgi:hypothetical protein
MWTEAVVDYFKALRKTIKDLSQDSQFLSQYSKPEPSKYEAGMLTTHTQYSADYYFEYLFGTVSSFPNTTSEQIFFFHK